MRKLLQNFSFLIVGRTLGDAFILLLFIVLSQAYGPEGLGYYSFAIGLTGFFSVFSDFGLYALSVKELSRHNTSLRTYFGGILGLRIALSAIGFSVLLIVLLFIPFSNEAKLIIGLVGIYQIFITAVTGFAAVFVSQERNHLAALLEISLKGGAALAAVGLALSGATLVIALIPLPVAALAQVLFAYLLVSKCYGSPSFSLSISGLLRLWRQAVPYGISMVLFQFCSRVDVVLLGLLINATAVGVYNAAYRLIFFLMFIPHFGAMALFPTSSKLHTDSPEALKKLYHQSLNLAVLIGLPVAGGIWLIAPNIINILFGDAFADSVPILRLLSWVLFLAFLSRIMDMFLMSTDRQTERTKSASIVTVVTVISNLVLIVLVGIEGAAISALISEGLLVILFTLKLKDLFGWPQVWSRLAIGGAGVASFCILFTLLPSVSLAVVFPVSAALYFAVLLLFNRMLTGQLDVLKSLLRGNS